MHEPQERADALARAVGAQIDWSEGSAELEGVSASFDRQANDLVVDDAAIRSVLGWSQRGSFEELAPELVDALRRSRAVA